MKICINTRSLSGPFTGVQRYSHEMVARFGDSANHVQPSNQLNGIKGHLWEQILLPRLTKNQLLWSPANCGPLLVSKQVVTIHDLSPLDHPEWMSRKFSQWYKFLIPRLARRVSHIITDSIFTKSRIVDLCDVSPSKISVIPIGVDKNFSVQTDENILRTITKLGIPSSRYFVSVGSLEPRKNLGRLLEAWRRAQSMIDNDIWLVLAGSLGDASVFGNFSLGEIPPRTFLTGRVDEDLLPCLYGGAIAAPYLSLYEGFGLPPLEAMACGTPPITSDCTSLPEVVGDAGFMVDPLDIDAIADAMIQLAQNEELRTRLCTRGIKRAELFSWDVTARETWKILESIF